MTRNQLWQYLKKAGITQSDRLDCPPDADLSVVIRHSPANAKTLIDFFCSLNMMPGPTLKPELDEVIQKPIL